MGGTRHLWRFPSLWTFRMRFFSYRLDVLQRPLHSHFHAIVQSTGRQQTARSREVFVRSSGCDNSTWSGTNIGLNTQTSTAEALANSALRRKHVLVPRKIGLRLAEGATRKILCHWSANSNVADIRVPPCARVVLGRPCATDDLSLSRGTTIGGLSERVCTKARTGGMS